MKIVLVLILSFYGLTHAGDIAKAEDLIVGISVQPYGYGLDLKQSAAIYKIQKVHPEYRLLMAIANECLAQKCLVTVEYDPYSMAIKNLVKKL